MAIDESIIKDCLGKAYKPDADYVVEHPHVAISRIQQGCQLVGQIETIGDGTMVILERTQKPGDTTQRSTE